MPGGNREGADFFETKVGKQALILKENADQFTKIQAAMTSFYVKNIEERKRAEQDLAKNIQRWNVEHFDERVALEKAIADATTKQAKKQAQQKLKDFMSELTAQEDALKKHQNDTLLLEYELEDKKKEVREKASETARIYEQNMYRKMSAAQRREYSKNIAAELKAKQETAEQTLAGLQDEAKTKEAQHQEELKRIQSSRRAQLKLQREIKQSMEEATAAGDEAAVAEAEKKLQDVQSALADLDKQKKDEQDKHKDDMRTNANQQSKTQAEIQDLSARKDVADAAASKFSKTELALSAKSRSESRNARAEAVQERVQNAEIRVEDAKAAVDSMNELFKKSKEYADLQKRLEDAKKRGDKRAISNVKEEIKNLEEKHEEEMQNSEEMQELQNAQQEEQAAKTEAATVGMLHAVSSAADSLLGASVDRISDNLDALYGDQGRMMGRLQGSSLNWAASLLKVTATVGVSGLVGQKEVVKRMTELVDSGVAYNLELRAFLAETSENIASTFDAANGTLLRLIRVQQQDTTAARLGMEASLTKLFNQYFQDTSYLTDSGAHDSVTDAIFEAMAGMSRDQAIEFEFTTQKWLGSLASVGMSNEAVTQIAQGLNYLGTGNVTQLNNSPALQTLFAMSAVRAGKSYSDILSGGLTADTTNDLLKAMIEYLAEIAASQDNQVTKSAYAELFGMSIADFNTFTSLTNSEITNLASMSTSYDKLVTETSSQLNKLITRISVSSMVDTAMDNAEVGAATLIGSNPITYGMWKAMSLLKTYVGEVEIPGITGMGNGLASGMDLLNLAQTGMAGIGLLGSLVAGLPSMLLGGPTNLALWNAFTGAKDSTSRGSNLSVLSGGTEDSTSQKTSVGVGNTSGDDISSTTEQSGMDKGYETAGTSEEELDEEKEIYKKIYAAIAEDESLTVISVLQDMADLLALDRIFMTNPLELSKDTSHLVNLYNANGFDYGKSLTTIANDYKQELLEAEKDPLLKQAISGKTTETLIKELQEKNGNSSFVETDFYKTTYTGDALTNYLESYQDNSLSELLIKEQIDNENDSLIILQDIRTLLDKNRVFYTAITGAFDSTTAGNILSLSSQLSTYSSAVTSNTTENTTQQTPTSATATSAISNMLPNSNSDVTAAAGHQDIGTIIAEAITKALSSINAIPVNVQNSSTTIP